MNKKTSNNIITTGLLLSAFALLASTLLGFGGFSFQAFNSYFITGYVSRLQMLFLILIGAGLLLSGLAYLDQAKKQGLKANLILLLHLLVSTVFFSASFFGIISKLRSTDFWAQTTFEEIQATLFFSNMTLACFFVLGILQVTLSIIFFKTRLLQRHHLSKVAKILTLASGIFLIAKTIIDYPFIKEAIFVLSYMLKIPFLNNLMALLVPLVYLLSQIFITIVLLHNRQSMA